MKKNLIRGVLLAGLVFALSATSLATRAESALGIRPGTPSISDFSSTPYMAMNGSAPMRWAACGTIDYQLNLREAPRGAAADAAAAIAEISSLSGLRFKNTGTTDEIPQSNWTNNRHAPLVIAWASAEETALLGRSTELAFGANESTARSGTVSTYVAGVVVIDATATTGLDVPSRRMLLLHELSHVIGLAHSHDPASYMYPVADASHQQITVADIDHLAALGATTCGTEH